MNRHLPLAGPAASLIALRFSPQAGQGVSKVKEQASSNKGLFESIADGVALAGVPVLVSTDVAAGNAWGVDASQIFVVQRTGTTVVKSDQAAFDYDAVQVRATARVSWGFANPAGVVRLYDAA